MAKNSPQDLENRQYFSTNLNRLMIEKAVRQIDLHNELDIPKSTITGYVKGRSMPTLGNLQKLADFLGVKKSNLDLRFLQHPTPSTNPLDQLTNKNKEKALNYITNLLDQQKESYLEEPAETYTVETVTKLAAGIGFFYDDTDTRTLTVGNPPPRYDIASIVDGDSMLPDYQDGNVVYLADTGFTSFSGQVCAVVIDDRSYIKKVYTEPHGLRLVSTNPKYKDIFIDFPPATDTHVKIFSVVGTDTPL